MDQASPQVMTSQGMKLLGREPLRARDRVACCLGGWGSSAGKSSYKSKQLRRQGWIRHVGYSGGGCALSVPDTCLISLLPGPGPREQVWSRLEEGKGQLGLAQYQERQQGQKLWHYPGKGRKSVSLRPVNWCSESCLPALAPRVLYS